MPRMLCLAALVVLLLDARAPAAPEAVAPELPRGADVPECPVRLTDPPDLDRPALAWGEKVPVNLNGRRAGLRLPRLVSQDKRTAAVCFEVPRPVEARESSHLD